jgi:flagellin-like hook-associated protein FlgL
MERMISGNNLITSKLSNVYRESAGALSDAIAKLASGKNFQNAADNLRGFTKNVNLGIDIRGYEDVRIKLADAKTITSAAVDCGGAVYKDLTKMKKYADNYLSEVSGNNDTVKLNEYRAGFDSLKDTVVSSLQNANVDGTLITQAGTPLKTVVLDPKNVGKLKIEFSAVPDKSQIDTFNITTMTDTTGIDTEISNALTYLSESKSYNAIIDRQMDFAGLIIKGKEAVKSLITNVDEAKVTSEVVDRSIRLEAAGAMIAQGNMLQNSMISLYGW